MFLEDIGKVNGLTFVLSAVLAVFLHSYVIVVAVITYWLYRVQKTTKEKVHDKAKFYVFLSSPCCIGGDRNDVEEALLLVY